MNSTSGWNTANVGADACLKSSAFRYLIPGQKMQGNTKSCSEEALRPTAKDINYDAAAHGGTHIAGKLTPSRGSGRTFREGGSWRITDTFAWQCGTFGPGHRCMFSSLLLFHKIHLIIYEIFILQ